MDIHQKLVFGVAILVIAIVLMILYLCRKSSKILSVPFCASSEGDCGAHTMWMILQYYGHNISIERIMQDRSGKTYEQYLAQFGLKDIFFSSGYDPFNPNANQEERISKSKNFIVEQINLDRPIDSAWGNPPHKILVVGYDGEIVVFHDGNGSPEGAYNRMPIQDFVVTRLLIECRSVYR